MTSRASAFWVTRGYLVFDVALKLPRFGVCQLAVFEEMLVLEGGVDDIFVQILPFGQLAFDRVVLRFSLLPLFVVVPVRQLLSRQT